MTTELTKAAQQALEALIEASGHVNNEQFVKVMMARDALVSALTQRPAAQTDEQTIVEICERIGFGHVQQIAGHAWEQRHNCAPRGRMGVTVRNEKPAPQQATPEPVRLGALMALTAECNKLHAALSLACSHLTDEQAAQVAAAMPDTAATPEPVGEPVGTVVHATLNGQAKPWVTVALNQDADLPNGTKLFTRPAPGVPEDVLAILDECRNALMECDRDGDYALIDRIDALAAAQAKGGE